MGEASVPDAPASEDVAVKRVRDEDLDPLVRAAQAGGEWAFASLWELLSPSVAGFVRAKGVRDVDDVVSEVFLAAFRGLSGFRGTGTGFRSWLFTIAHHKTVDEIRGRARGGGNVEYLPEIDNREAASAESVAFDRLGTDEVRRLLDGLTPEQRDVLLLRVLGDMTVTQTAQALGRTEDAIKKLQRRAVAQLRKRVPDPVPL